MGIEREFHEFNDSGSGVYPDTAFEGIYEEYWRNGQLKYRGEFEVNRKRVGQHVSFWENGNVKEISYWINGWVRGTVARFNEDGVRESEIYYGERGSRRRTWIERSFGCTSGELICVRIWQNDDFKTVWMHDDLKYLMEDIDTDVLVKKTIEEWMDECSN